MKALRQIDLMGWAPRELWARAREEHAELVIAQTDPLRFVRRDLRNLRRLIAAKLHRHCRSIGRAMS